MPKTRLMIALTSVFLLLSPALPGFAEEPSEPDSGPEAAAETAEAARQLEAAFDVLEEKLDRDLARRTESQVEALLAQGAEQVAFRLGNAYASAQPQPIHEIVVRPASSEGTTGAVAQRAP